jgi:hypothetical protein
MWGLFLKKIISYIVIFCIDYNYNILSYKLKGDVHMDKETFFTMPPSTRVLEVNKLLQEHDQKNLSKLIGVPSSTFSKYMREGDYLYHKADKKYYPFVRSEDARRQSTFDKDRVEPELTYLMEHHDVLKKLIQYAEENELLLLDKRIYSKDTKYVNKSIRMNTVVYEDFSSFCEEYYPHLKMQDVIAQALLDAISRYKPAN